MNNVLVSFALWCQLGRPSVRRIDATDWGAWSPVYEVSGEMILAYCGRLEIQIQSTNDVEGNHIRLYVLTTVPEGCQPKIVSEAPRDLRVLCMERDGKGE